MANTEESARSNSTTAEKSFDGFTPEEREAMKDHARERALGEAMSVSSLHVRVGSSGTGGG
ncbi:hypothetical protein [Streptomyces sp. NRRL B-24484]|uniref:hypothetical protein n=1 Tax=Streptomyces sp. NRRL B-24484 TaxID=1463833 RepID=UPI0004C11465|nr:hypothetical protein [Streptomyces sp. NRRL B-24484]